MSEEIEIARQWLAKARNDILNADNNLNSELVPFDTVCFHCQQAAEKMLKSYIIPMNISYTFFFKTCWNNSSFIRLMGTGQLLSAAT